MSGYRIIVHAEIDEVTATRIARIVKAALEPLRVETYTFTDQQFQAHWRPNADPQPTARIVSELEHRQPGRNGRRLR